MADQRNVCAGCGKRHWQDGNYCFPCMETRIKRTMPSKKEVDYYAATRNSDYDQTTTNLVRSAMAKTSTNAKP